MLKSEFQKIYDDIKLLMEKALKNSDHPYRTFSLASLDKKVPKLRTVVLREFSFENSFFDCHSDIRSPKVIEFKKNNKFSALFYSSEKKNTIKV